LLGPHFVFLQQICFLFVFYNALKLRKKKFVEFFYSILLGLLFGSFCVTIGSYYVIVWLFSSFYLSSITLLFDFWVIIQLFLGYYLEPLSWISYCCLTSFGLLFDFWLLFISSYCYSNFLLLFNTSNIIIWPNVIQLISKLKIHFLLSSHMWLLLLALLFGFSCDVAYQLNNVPHLFCASLRMKSLDPIHQVTFSILSDTIYKLCFQQFCVFLFGC
jgi:hypothetical protein